VRRRVHSPVEGAYDPAAFWERRAPELIDAYDHPETWQQRSWLEAGVEERLVPRLLGAAGCESVVVAGSGSGRQYVYLLDAGLRVSGFDLSPTLVAECRRRFPGVVTTVADVVDAAESVEPADAVVTSAVLQHVPPALAARAADSLMRLARTLIVIRETTWLSVASSYQFAHDYFNLFAGWDEVERLVTDEGPHFRAELVAWRRGA